ncbi:hypothetical protein Hanom_Chr07g00647731 [Helianthus anomalus]
MRLENADESSVLWRLVGDTTKGSMVMSFNILNRIANFDSLGVGSYYYYDTNLFLHLRLVQADPVNLVELTLPNYTTGEYNWIHLSVEGKILQNISLENVMVR